MRHRKKLGFKIEQVLVIIQHAVNALVVQTATKL